MADVQLYVDLMLLVISLLTLSMSVGLNSPLILTQNVVRWIGLVLRFITKLSKNLVKPWA